MTEDDDLMRLWQQGRSGAPDGTEVARLAARASMRRFERIVARRNLAELLAAAGVLAWFGWNLVVGHERITNAISFASVAFVVIYLWWRHRHAVDPDPAASAETYHAALVASIDRQIDLLRTAWYWYLLPLYVPPVLQGVSLWEKSRTATVVLMAVVTAVYIGIGMLNSRVGVQRLRDERARLDALYQE